MRSWCSWDLNLGLQDGWCSYGDRQLLVLRYTCFRTIFYLVILAICTLSKWLLVLTILKVLFDKTQSHGSSVH